MRASLTDEPDQADGAADVHSRENMKADEVVDSWEDIQVRT